MIGLQLLFIFWSSSSYGCIVFYWLDYTYLAAPYEYKQSGNKQLWRAIEYENPGRLVCEK